MKSVALSKQNVVMVLLLTALMAATRFNHFGTAVSPPDASLAVFFLAGFYLSSFVLFPLFIVEAGFIDYVVTTFGGVSNWCITPGYLFLIPTYGVLWFAGSWYARRHQESLRTLLPLSVSVLVSTSLAFLISNVSFYFLSGYFSKMGPGEYAVSVAKYYPPYVGIAVVYVALAGIIHSLAYSWGFIKLGSSISNATKNL